VETLVVEPAMHAVIYLLECIVLHIKTCHMLQSSQMCGSF